MANQQHNAITGTDLHAVERRYAGNPNGNLSGILGQYCQDTNTGDVYRSTGGTSWEKIIDATVGGGGAAGSDGQVQYNNGGDLAGASGLIYDDTTTRVGVNVASPSATLDVGGNQRLRGDLTLNKSNAGQPHTIYNENGGSNLVVYTNSGDVVIDDKLVVNEGAVFNEDGLDNDFRVESSNVVNMLTVDASADRVGVGTGAPTHGALQIAIDDFDNGLVLYDGTDVPFRFWRDSGYGNIGRGSSTPAISIDGLLRVGIGKNPSANLDVSGDGVFSGNLSAVRLTLTQASGTAPMTVTSNTVVTNLNADLWDGYQFADYLNQGVRTTDAVTFATVNTGHGDNELYAMDQNVRTTDAVTFATVNTGHGANELYAMDQNVRTTDAVTFATVNTGQGNNELYAMDQNVRTTDGVTFASVNTGHGANELYPMNQAVRTSDSPSFTRLTLSQASGTAPMTITSTTVVTNLNADLLDGNHATAFHTAGYPVFSGDSETKDDITTRTESGFWQTSSATTAEGWPLTTNSWQHLLSVTHSNDSNYYAMQFAGNFYSSNDIFYRATGGSGTTAWNRIWHSGNDGFDSGLDADLLDGQDSSYYLNYANFTGTAPTVAAGTDGQVQYNNGGVLGGANALYYDDVNGRVGIGTATPDVKLDIEGTGGELLRLRDTDGSYTALTLYNDASNANSRNWGIYNNGYNFGDFNIISSTTNTGAPDIINATRLTINKDGNVGIGTASPTDTNGYGRALDIRGSTTGNGGVIYLRNSDGSVGGQVAVYGDGRMDLGTTTAHPLKLYTSNSEKMRISSGGTLMLGDSIIPAEVAWKGTAVFGPNGTDKVITGYLIASTNGAVIGGHNSALTAWAPLAIAGTELRFNHQESRIMTMNSTGLGIGITNASYKLDIAHSGSYNQVLLNGGWDNALSSNSRLNLNDPNFGIGAGQYGGGVTDDATVIWSFDGAGRGVLFASTSSGTTTTFQSMQHNMFIDGSSGNVGIGTTSPNARIHSVNNNFTTSQGFLFEGYKSTYGATSPVVYIKGNWEYNTSRSTDPILKVAAYNDPNGFYVLHSGNVGIGTAPSGSYKLHVNGGAAGSNPSMYVQASTYGMIGVARGANTASAGINYYDATPSQKWFTGIYENSNNFGFYNVGYSGFPVVIQDTTGYVGIGTTNPKSDLEVYTASTGAVGGTLRLNNIGTAVGDKTAILFDDSGTGASTTAVRGAIVCETEDNPYYGRLLFKTGLGNLSSGLTDRMVILGNGNVGIGTTSPNAKLDVRGSVVFNEDQGNNDFRVESDTDSYALFLDASASCVGISTASPNSSYSFHVGGGNALIENGLDVVGTLSKGGGSFRIPHPDPAKPTMELWHSFIEAPTAGENLYRWQVEVKDGIATILLPDYYKHLNENHQVWISPEEHFGRAYGKVDETENYLVVKADQDGLYNVLLIGTRKDPIAKKAWKGAERDGDLDYIRAAKNYNSKQ